MRKAITLIVILFMATVTLGAPGGVPGSPGNPGDPSGNPGGEPGGGGSDPFASAEVVSLLVIRSASSLSSNILVQLIDEADAQASPPLGLE